MSIRIGIGLTNIHMNIDHVMSNVFIGFFIITLKLCSCMYVLYSKYKKKAIELIFFPRHKIRE